MDKNKQFLNSFISLQNIQLFLKSEAGYIEILKNINFFANKGETISIVGPSGAGKTSLMMLLGGLEKATSGKIFIANENIQAMNEDKLTKFRQKHISIVFQNFHLIPTMTALENVAVPLEFMYDKLAFSKAKDVLEQVGLSNRLKHYPSQLSGGEQQRVALARAFVTKPHLLLADEPTGNLDAETGRQVMKLMFNLAENNNTTLVMVTHDKLLAKRCNRIVKIKDGIIE